MFTPGEPLFRLLAQPHSDAVNLRQQLPSRCQLVNVDKFEYAEMLEWQFLSCWDVQVGTTTSAAGVGSYLA